jgi:hypothetical protein
LIGVAMILDCPALNHSKPYSFERFFDREIDLMLRRSDPDADRQIGVENVLQRARMVNRGTIGSMCEKLLFPGSGLEGLEHLEELAARAERGEPGLVLAWHTSNMDVPNLYTLLARQGRSELFDRLVFLAGRKLNEESAVAKVVSEAFPRLVVSPPSYFRAHRDDARALADARAVNRAALRKARGLLSEGRMLILFPAATRYRPEAPETGRALSQVDGYLRMCRNFVVLNIRGNTLPPVTGAKMVTEEVCPDVVRHIVGPVCSAADFRREVLSAHGDLPEPRQAVADAVMRRIHAL